MFRTTPPFNPALLGLFVCALLFGACGKKIGDKCRISYDCQTQDDSRTCDVSQPGGYCTIEGCDERSCPSESACIRFFPLMFVYKPCTAAEPNACTPDELCLPENKCAPRATERRYCALTCDDDDDCRDGYECRLAGTLGSVALTRIPNQTIRFCAPRVSP